MGPTATLPFRPDLQGLRALAVALVVLCHLGVPAFAGGFVGVDVFFVLSGYLITGLLVAELQQRGRIGYAGFLARRLRRLLPALLVMIVVTLAAAGLLLSSYEFRIQTDSLLFAATWTSNLYFAFRDFDYFSALASRDLFLHTWSLGVEEQFYLIWPLLLAGLVILARRLGQASQIERVLSVSLGLLAFASFALCIAWSDDRPLQAFYMMPARIWQFGLGALICLGAEPRLSDSDPRPLGKQTRRQAVLLRVSGLALILGSAAFLGSDLAYPGWRASLPSAGAALVIAAGTGARATPLHLGLAHPLAVWLGDRSYSLYLWHWPIVVLGGAFAAKQSALTAVLLVLLAMTLAAISYRFVEYPFWKGALSRSRPLKTFSTASIAMAGVGLGSMVVASTNGHNLNPARWQSGYDPRQDAPPIYTRGFRCDEGHFSDRLEPCGIGSKDAPHTAVMIGDSIGVQWVSAIPEIFSPPKWQVIVLTKSACPMVDEDYFYERIGENYAVCSAWRDKALRFAADLQPDVVLLGSDAYYPFSESQWVEGTSRVLEILRPVPTQVAIIPGTPQLSFDGPSCLEEPEKFTYRASLGGRQCVEPATDSRVDEVGRYLRQAAAQFPAATVLDLGDLVCPYGYCSAMSADGTVVYRDRKHVTNSFAVARAQHIRARLAESGIAP